MNINNIGLIIKDKFYEALTEDGQFSLVELINNGYAEKLDNESIQIPFDSIYKLTEYAIYSLGLPEFYPFELFIRTNGKALVDDEFSFTYDFLSFSGLGDRLFFKVIGNILFENETMVYLLDEPQFQLCSLIDQKKKFESVEDKLLFLHQLKKMSLTSNISFDAILSNEELEVPTTLKLDIDFLTDELVQFKPHFTEDKLEQEKVLKSFEIYPKVKSLYPIQKTDGKRKRFLLKDDQKKQLEIFKTRLKDKKTNKEAKDIIESIHDYFDDEKFDISVVYSDRVIKSGLYEPKYYPFIQPYKSEWIAGIQIKSENEGTKRIHVKDVNDLRELRDAIHIATISKSKSVNYKGQSIPLDKAVNLAELASEQIRNPKKPIEKNTFEVLIIKENAESLEYKDEIVQFEDLKIFNFYPISNLKSIFSLKQHQQEGIAWLQYLYSKNASGGLLADDMGLGKTIQILYFLEWHKQFKNIENKPYLIIAPVSLLENWENEYDKFFSPCSLEIRTVYGNLVPSTKEVDLEFIKKHQKSGILLTNYETLRLYQKTLCAIDFAVVAIDEAQKVKTPGTLITNSVKAIKSDFNIAMTGTPVENSLVDLWCIIDFVAPGLLSTAKEFAKKYQNPLKDEQTDIVKHGEQLRSEIGYYLTRRVKKDVAIDLPEKIVNRYEIPMSTYHEDMYLGEVERYLKLSQESDKSKGLMLTLLHNLKTISDHPYLLTYNINKVDVGDLVRTSKKLEKTLFIIDEIQRKNEKVIIFADRKETQELLTKVVYHTFGFIPSRINGDTPSTKQDEEKSKKSRQQTVNIFEAVEGFNVIIMSPIAAGVGLNVTAANHIIHYSRHWNPAKEQQATDRAYRIGQTKPVYVHYPLSISQKFKSFELTLDELLKNKSSIASSTLFPTEQMEVSVKDMFTGLGLDLSETSKNTELSESAIDFLSDYNFEAFVACLFKANYRIELTPKSGDRGADVLLFSEKNNYLIQVKHTSKSVDMKAVQEIVAAKKYYEDIKQVTFGLKVVTNGEFTTAAKELSESNSVELISRSKLLMLQNEQKVTENEVLEMEMRRSC